MEQANLRKKFLLLQINDALFPIGGYSHSYGLETYIQKDLVRDGKTAKKYIEHKLKYGFLYTELLPARLAFEYASENDMEKLMELEEITQASKLPREIRLASNKLASRFIKTISKLDISYESKVFHLYLENIKKTQKGLSNYAIVYGIFCAAVGISKEEAMEHFLYAQTSAMVTNCVKSIPLSQTEGQKLLVASCELFLEILETVCRLDESMLYLSNPGFDIRSMQHEFLYSRIYMS